MRPPQLLAALTVNYRRTNSECQGLLRDPELKFNFGANDLLGLKSGRKFKAFSNDICFGAGKRDPTPSKRTTSPWVFRTRFRTERLVLLGPEAEALLLS